MFEYGARNFATHLLRLPQCCTLPNLFPLKSAEDARDARHALHL
jgi:hypothetical protein